MKDLITQFYEAFQAKDGQKMASFYHEDIVFEDPAFGQLKGERAGKMWEMLCESQQDKPFVVTFSNIKENENEVTAHWEAKYEFGPSKKKVHNKIDATFTFKNGKILTHVDVFNLKQWSKQAIGPLGGIIGGTSFFKKKLNTKTNKLLDKYLAKETT